MDSEWRQFQEDRRLSNEDVEAFEKFCYAESGYWPRQLRYDQIVDMWREFREEEG